MRRRMLSQMQTEQDARNTSEALRNRIVRPVRLTMVMVNNNPDDLRMVFENDSVAPQGTMPSSPQGLVPPAPAAPKRGPGRPRKDAQ